MKIFHFCLNALLLLSGAFVFLSENPVYSVLFLILTFCVSSIIMFIFHVEFLGLIFMIIYVGAIAILFLFVVMMLNVKVPSKFNSWGVYLFILCCLAFILEILITINAFFFDFDCTYSQDYFGFFLIDDLNNTDIIGQTLYNYFAVSFLLCGLILLVAMLGAIVLTLNFKSYRNSELVSRQLSKSSNFLNHII